MVQDNNNQPKLFGGEIPRELTPNTYYAYLDSVERVKTSLFVRFDCIEKNVADENEITKENIFKLPSIVIDISGDYNTLNERLGFVNLYNLESSWLIIRTSIEETNLQQQLYYNFTNVGGENSLGNFNLESVTFFSQMSTSERLKIQQLSNATTLIESDEKDVYQFLNNVQLNNEEQYVNVYNVGQGNCNAVVKANQPILYFDVGGGCAANQKTFPTNFRLCSSNNPPVILSHWDLDHVFAATLNANILNSKWLVPKHRNLSLTAMHIAQYLVVNKNLTCWNNSLTNVNFQGHTIVKCTGNPQNKNSSGLALFVNYGHNGYVLLPGDATFNKIPLINNFNLIGIVASHHGAKGAIVGMPRSNRGMLAYSYGLNNTHQHPHSAAKSAYWQNGWTNSLKTINGNIAIERGLTTLSTPCGGRCTLDIVQQY